MLRESGVGARSIVPAPRAEHRASIYYDSRTRVLFQGQTYQPSDLERGDQIDARAYPGSNGQYVADTITVTRNVRQ